MSVTTIEHIWKAVEDELFSDFTIIVNDGENPTKEFRVHRLFLKIGSPVFRAMLENDMKEAKTGVCEITDIKPETIKLTLRHIYGYKFDECLDLEDALDLITAADKYGIQSLISDSSKHIENILNIRNCAKLFSNSGFLSMSSELKNKCYELFKENAYELLGEGLNRDEFMVNISEDVLLEILDLEDINVDSELEIIKFVEVWASKNVDTTAGTFLHDVAIRTVLEKNILSKIRFLTLSSSAFYEYFFSCGWLSSGERKLVLDTIKLQTIPDNFPIYLSNSKTKRCLQIAVKELKPKQSNEILIQLGRMISGTDENSKPCDFFFHSVKDGNKLVGFRFCCILSQRNPNRNSYYNGVPKPIHLSLDVNVKVTDEIGCTIDIVRFKNSSSYVNGISNVELSCYLNYPLILKKNKKYRMKLEYHASTSDTNISCSTPAQSIIQDKSNNIIISENGKLGPITHLILL